MAWSCFRVDVEDRVAHVVLPRPEKRTSMIPKLWGELPAAVQQTDGEARARAIVLSAEGPHFAGGLDLGLFATIASSSDERDARLQLPLAFLELVRTVQDALSSLERCRIPVIAAVQGGCIGGRVDLVTACDIRYASADAFFSIEETHIGMTATSAPSSPGQARPVTAFDIRDASADAFFSIEETHIGMTADVGTFPRLGKLVPEGVVRELAYTGRRLPADEAHAIGLVSQVLDDQASLVEHALTMARTIAKKAPIAVHGCKQAITHARDHRTEDRLEYVRLWNASMHSVEQIMGAIAAKAEERDGDFAGLPPLGTILDP